MFKKAQKSGSISLQREAKDWPNY